MMTKSFANTTKTGAFVYFTHTKPSKRNSNFLKQKQSKATQQKMKRLVRLAHFIMKLTLVSRRIEPNLGEAELEHETVPHDIKEGHFAVLAGNGEEKKRFVVGLNHLRNPEFLRLLDQAKDEFGFDHGGLLVVPCSPEELNKIVEDGM